MKMTYLGISKINTEHFLVSTKAISIPWNVGCNVRLANVAQMLKHVTPRSLSATWKIKTPVNYLLPQQLTLSVKMAWEMK